MKDILLLMLLKEAGIFLHFADFMHENDEA